MIPSLKRQFDLCMDLQSEHQAQATKSFADTLKAGLEVGYEIALRDLAAPTITGPEWLRKNREALAKAWSGTLPVTDAEEYYGDAYYFIDLFIDTVKEVSAQPPAEAS